MPETYKGQFGPSVIGEEAHEEEQQEVYEERRDVFGEAVRSGSHMESRQAPQEAADAETQAESEEEGREFPDGYEVHQAGAYFDVTAPDGEQVSSETPSGKWKGRDDALDAAWEHARQAEAEAEEEVESEAEEAEGEGEDEEAADREIPEDIEDATIEEVEEALAANPHMVDDFTLAEIQRPDGVRPEVLDALEAAEKSKEAPRDEVFTTIESLRAEE